jgi:hypothetical protein
MRVSKGLAVRLYFAQIRVANGQRVVASSNAIGCLLHPAFAALLETTGKHLFPHSLGVRFQKNEEGEVACALDLLQDLVGQLGRLFLDLLLGDALYLQAPFVKQVGVWG